MASLESPDPRVMFARFFTACFQARQDRASLSSDKSSAPAEGCLGTEGGNDSSLRSHNPNLPETHDHIQLPTEQPDAAPSKPLPIHSIKDPDMPKAPKKPIAKSFTKSPLTPAGRTKSKYKYFTSNEPEDNGLGITPPKNTGEELDKMFDGFLTKDDVNADKSKNTMGAASMVVYTSGLGVSDITYEPFVLLDLVQADRLGQITRKGFVNGWKHARMDDAEKPETAIVEVNLPAQKRYLEQQVAKAATDYEYFKTLYQRAFIAGKEPEQKALDKEFALAFWDMLFYPSLHPWRSKNVNWLELWKEFLRAKWKRGVSKDMWTQTLAFHNKTMQDETLRFWSEDQAWPSVIDDFVRWCRETSAVPSQKTNATDGVGDDE